MITRAHIYRDRYSLTFDGEPIPQVDVIVCLGVAIDKLWTMAKHLDRLREKRAKGLTLCCWTESNSAQPHSSDEVHSAEQYAVWTTPGKCNSSHGTAEVGASAERSDAHCHWSSKAHIM
jgi:hypothetical protein